MRIFLVLGAVLLLALSPLNASRGVTDGATGTDDFDAIVAAAMNYAMSYYEGDGNLMESALHPHLAKRTIAGDEGQRQSLSPMSALELVQIIRAGHGKQVPEDQRMHEVEVLDLQGDVATVKLEMDSWFDYMHLAKLNGRWQIVNVLWRRK